MDGKSPSENKGKEEPGEVHFVDKRRFKEGPDEQAAGQSEPTRAAEPSPQPESPTKPPPEPGRDERRPPGLTELPDVYALLSAYVATLGSQAFVWMGLLKDPISGKVRKDMAQAKVAIDVCEFLIGQIDPKLGEQDRRELARMLSDLKVNFVSQSRTES
jgi:hypothetical protein